MKHNSIENNFTDEANTKNTRYKFALTLRSPLTTLCTITFNIQEIYFCMEHKTNSDYFPVKNHLIALCNSGTCFLRGTNCLCFELISILKETV
jgi:hypothetical protein